MTGFGGKGFKDKEDGVGEVVDVADKALTVRIKVTSCFVSICHKNEGRKGFSKSFYVASVKNKNKIKVV